MTPADGPSVARRGVAIKRALAVFAVAAGSLGLVWLGRSTAPAPTLPSFQRLTFRPGQVDTARFAPDGETILYSAKWGNRPIELFSTRSSTRGERPLALTDALILAISLREEMAILLRPQQFAIGIFEGTLARAPLARRSTPGDPRGCGGRGLVARREGPRRGPRRGRAVPARVSDRTCPRMPPTLRCGSAISGSHVPATGLPSRSTQWLGTTQAVSGASIVRVESGPWPRALPTSWPQLVAEQRRGLVWGEPSSAGGPKRSAPCRSRAASGSSGNCSGASVSSTCRGVGSCSEAYGAAELRSTLAGAGPPRKWSCPRPTSPS